MLCLLFSTTSYLTPIHSLCNRTFRKGCPAHISLRANDRGSALQVKSVCFDHNHEISQVMITIVVQNSINSHNVCLQELFRHLPLQRQLSAATKAKVASLLQMDANKKLVQQQISQESGKIVLLKDLANIATNSKKGKSKNDLDTSVSQLIDKYGK